MQATDPRQELIEAREACQNFVITAKTGAIRAYPRGPVLGTVERAGRVWGGYIRDYWAGGSTKRGAAISVLDRVAASVTEAFLVALIERHPTRLDDIREAIATPWREDPNALGGLCSERDLERALRAVEINRSVKESA
jgi:hypothetical protein